MIRNFAASAAPVAPVPLIICSQKLCLKVQKMRMADRCQLRGALSRLVYLLRNPFLKESPSIQNFMYLLLQRLPFIFVIFYNLLYLLIVRTLKVVCL